ncbi:probable disease resistance protein RF9 [Quercus lobata]|uniref:NB-ARC domain-containing protein n=1 Tax=Quercus lobata TaxID=97700 RepID=A0A7N2LKY0_QUELO|nr:probable disease resistance protein RF9 [Quercus lobata]
MTLVTDVPISILLEKLVKSQKLLDEERFVFPGLRNRVANAIEELQRILRILEAGNTSDFKAQLLGTVYSVENITENFLFTTAQRRPKGIFKTIKTPLKLLPIPSWHQLQFSYKMMKFVKNLRAICDPDHDQDTAEREERHSPCCHQHNDHQDADEVLVGREDEEKKLVGQLFDDNEKSLRVISLVSEKPLGKTAMARTVYNRLDVRQHFPCRAWLHVHEDFEYEDINFKDLLFSILKQIPIRELKDVELMSEKTLCAELFKNLMEFRYLIVLDDVPTVEVWSMFAYPFADAVNVSRVILTTRDSNVASHADPWNCPLNLIPLSEQGSWALFLKKFSKPQNSSGINNFREDILRICHGLPPAILLLGGVLSTVESSEWSWVIDYFDGGQSSLPNFVALSYQKLPHVLKPCFLYFLLFPKGYEIPTRRLLRLWIAEGFVQISPNESEVPEDVAKRNLEELVCRNMIEIASLKSDGTHKTCRMPSYLYEEFLPKVEDIEFLHIHHRKSYCRSAESPKFNIRRLADQFDTKSTMESQNIKHLCSYVSFDVQKQDTSNREIGMLLKTITNRRGFQLLKVIDLEGVYKPLLPEKLGVLQNLRYIGLRWTGLDSCPASIGDLPSLEFLDLKYTNITTLPNPIWKAKNLRYLYMKEVSIRKPSKKPSTNLHTLMGLLIGSTDPEEYGLNSCISLRKLGLTCHSESAVKTAECISRLGNLQTLRLRSRDPFGQPLDLALHPMKDHQSLSSLYLFGKIKDHDIGNLPRNLKILRLSMSELENDPMPELGKLLQLNTLRLFAGSYRGKEMTCLHGNFPKLRVLKLWKLDGLEQLTIKEGSMPQLELEIRGCEKLKRSDGLEELPFLKELILTNMPQEFVEDATRRLGSDKLLTNNWNFSPLKNERFILYLL